MMTTHPDHDGGHVDAELIHRSLLDEPVDSDVLFARACGAETGSASSVESLVNCPACKALVPPGPHSKAVVLDGHGDRAL